jgi:transporter family-2 protein
LRDGIPAAWLYPIILIAGALQAWGPPMNNALRKALANPWLASVVSFLCPDLVFLTCDL